MKIRMKVKHLVGLFISIITIIPLMIFIINPQISLFVAKKKFEQGDAETKAEIIDLLNGNLLKSQKWNIVEEYMIDYSLANQFDVIAGPSFSQFSENETKFTKEEKMPILEEYVESGPIDGYLSTAAIQLASYYEKAGQLEKANDILSQTIDRFSTSGNSWYKDELQIEQIKMLINRSEYKKAEQILQELMQNKDPSNYYFNAEISALRATNFMKQGNLQEALQEVKQGLKEYKEEWETENEENPEFESERNTVAFEQLLSLERHLTKAIQEKGNVAVTVAGKVIRRDGTPVKNVGIFLREGSNVNRSVDENEPYQTVTNEDGVYEFKGVIPGNYQIFLGFMFDQIDGWSWPISMDEWIDIDGAKNIAYDITLHELINIESPKNHQKITGKTVSFAWEEVEGAAYYNLQLGVEIEAGSISTGFKTHITKNKLDVPIDELYAQSAGVLFSDDDIEDFDPSALLAFTNTENRFFWSVEAYRANGELISQSNGYRLNENSIGNLPFFYLQSREMTKADHLLLNKKGKEALATYKAAFENDPNDVHSLRMITRMIRKEASESGLEEEKLVIPYLTALANKGVASSDDLFTLAKYYYDEYDWSSFEKWFKQYEQSIGGKENLAEYDQAIYASALMKQGKLKEAREQFKEVMKKDKSNRFVGSWLAVEIYLGESFNSALNIASKFPERPLGGEHNNWFVLITNLNEEASSFELYEQELRKVLQLYFNHQEVELNEWLETTNKPAMKEFMEAVRAVN